jgi:hypothetical protein
MFEWDISPQVHHVWASYTMEMKWLGRFTHVMNELITYETWHESSHVTKVGDRIRYKGRERWWSCPVTNNILCANATCIFIRNQQSNNLCLTFLWSWRKPSIISDVGKGWHVSLPLQSLSPWISGRYSVKGEGYNTLGVRRLIKILIMSSWCIIIKYNHQVSWHTCTICFKYSIHVFHTLLVICFACCMK